MILIISSPDDFSTHEVIDWLLYYKHPFLRVWQRDLVEIQKLRITNNNTEIEFCVKGKIYNNNDFGSIWYRRSWLSPDYRDEHKKTRSVLQKSINDQLLSEKLTLFHLLSFNLYKNSINNPNDCNINKLITLQLAVESGLKAPYTEVLTTKKDLKLLRKSYPKLITKCSTQGIFVNSSKEAMNILTLEVSDEMIKGMPDVFFPTVFQEKIEKKFELRIFFLEDEFFASAIFSQNDSQTSVDFRNYNFKHPNRTPPFKLPINIQQQLVVLMQKLKLNSGSIDMILSQEGEYVFLEVSPIGQYKQVSNPCNYYIERTLAKKLIEKDEKSKV